jgi:cation:H+ antiporter
MVLNIFVGLVLLILIVLSSGVVVDVFERFVSRLPIKRKRVMAILIGFSLALPELFVGIAAALDGKPQIALGNVVGANMANLSLVIGGLAILAVAIPVVGEYMERDLWVTIGLALLPFFMLFDGTISKVEGGVLIALYFVYAFFLSNEKAVVKQVKKKITGFEKWGLPLMLILGLVIMAVCSWQLVQIAVQIAAVWGVSWFWMGLLLISFGTTLPELLLLSFSRNKSKASLVLPDLLSNVVMNSTLILGIVAIMTPIVMKESMQRGLSGMFLVIILGLFWLFTKSKRKLERWEGVVLIGIYLMFIGLQFMFA